MSSVDKNKSEFKFSTEQKENLINFVKSNKVLYVNARDNMKRELRASLWKSIGHTIHKSPDICRKKWIYMRDRFLKKLKRANTTKWLSRDDKLLMFLLDVYPELQAKAEHARSNSDGCELSNFSDVSSTDFYDRLNGTEIDDSNFVEVQSFSAESPIDNADSNDQNELSTTDLLETKKDERNHRKHSPTTSMWMSQELDPLDKFLLGLGATIRTFPAIEIAKLKLELSNIVFNKEVAFAEARAKDQMETS